MYSFLLEEAALYFVPKILLVVHNCNFNNDIINGDTKMCCVMEERNPTFKHT